MRPFSRRSFLAVFAVAAASSLGPAHAEDTHSSETRVALSGYDPVSYFIDHHPEKGSEQFTAAFDDATYWFKNEEHRAMFVANPDAYAPQYGGYCAVSMSQGVKAEPDPQAWTIADGKLYVFRAKMGVTMFKEQAGLIVSSAEQHWPELKGSP